MHAPRTFTNPVIAGNFADPSVLRVGSDYFMTHTSLRAMPGLLIWHSRDLVHWKPVASALHDYIGDVWAPDFVYHQGQYYIYFPANRTNWVITAPSPYGPWSKPVDLDIKGIDPGHIVGPDGKRYLHMSDGYIAEISADGLSAIGEPRHVYDGWKYPDDWLVEAFSMEGPKLTYRDGYYYLIVAEAGTSGPPTSHMVVAARSRSPWGPWENSPYNPVVRTKSREERWWSKGHGSLIDTPDGRWYIVYHGYLHGYHSLGRQTLLEPVEWTADGWFKTLDGVTPDRPIEAPPGESEAAGCGLAQQDDFRGDELGLHWQTNGCLPRERFVLGPNGVRVRGADAGRPDESPLLYMAQDEAYEAEVELTVRGAAEARLLLYYDPQHWLGIGASAGGVRHLRSFKQYRAMPAPTERLRLKIRNDRHLVHFYFSADGDAWSKYDKVVDASGFHHNTLGGFLSLRIGLDAVGDGEVVFHRFQYRRLDSGEEQSGR